MRLIDADALRDRLQSLAYDDWNQGVCTTWANAYSECADMVEDAQTIETESIEQIRWERDVAIQQLADLGYGLGEKPISPCQNCSNNPKNGGSGICHCILGTQLIY